MLRYRYHEITKKAKQKENVSLVGFIYTRVNAGGSDPDKTGLWSLPNVHLGEFETSLKNYQRKRTKFQSDTKTSTLSICKTIRTII